ncbi:MAG: hypothetical protein ACTSQE_14395 [Candidatus Heimdallarchaeaceae archaeon]
MKTFFKTLILSILSWAIFPIVFVIGFIYSTLKHIIKLDYSLKKQFYPIVMAMALIRDGMANAGAGELFNDTVLKRKKDKSLYKGSYKYGKWYDTISAVTGVDEKRGKINGFGKFFTALLSFTLGKNHSIESIKEDRIYVGEGETLKENLKKICSKLK